MRTRIVIATTLCLLAACSKAGNSMATPATPADAPKKTMHAFANEAELQRFLGKWQAQARRRQEEQTKMLESVSVTAAMPAPAAPVADEAAPAGNAAEAESITNVQTAGVEEGGIVKRHGEHLVVLRRGRLFTLKVGNDSLQPVSAVHVYPPGVDPDGDWYDEMLIADDTIAVIGYSYARGGTEVGLFDIDAAGTLKYRASYQLRSNDYYSANNYASRLIGDKLIFYTPLSLSLWNGDASGSLPAYRRWKADASDKDFKRILPATRIYRTDDDLDPARDEFTLHTVTTCDLSTPDMACESTAVLGPAGRVFYVSQDSVFVWTLQYNHEDNKPNRSAVFRIPLRGGAPSALKTSGGPLDQLSFLHGDDGYLNVLLRADADGEGMWAARTSAGDVALLRVKLSDFGDGSTTARAQDYRALPSASGYGVQNRFIGDWLVYGTRQFGSRGVTSLRYADRQSPLRTTSLGWDAIRIEALGKDALVVTDGERGDLRFNTLKLVDDTRQWVSTYVQPGAQQGESRTHGFFYKPASAETGMLGLPILGSKGAAVLYLRNQQLKLRGMGQLDSRESEDRDDSCKASCVDWYGNARPIFIGDRVFALMGYELVEGRVADGRISERRRVSFSPNARIRISR